jgi:hypothetical protein
MSTWDKTYTNFKPSGMRRNVVADFAEMDKETELSM